MNEKTLAEAILLANRSQDALIAALILQADSKMRVRLQEMFPYQYDETIKALRLHNERRK